MSIFLFSLAGIPPLGGWFAKFVIFKALASPGTTAGYVLAVIVGVNSVVALFYYARVAQHMWMQAPPDEDRSPVRVPPSLVGALALCTVVTLVLGVAPGLVGEIGDVAEIAVPNVFG
jgi:NADH-quinone oxidoreductase subunit N